MKFSLLAGTWLVLGARIVLAQSYAETALLFSRNAPGGSARVQAMGGVQSALGGDYSSAYSNPAGLGMYNRSEGALTLGYVTDETSAAYLGNTTRDNYSTLAVPGLSLVINKVYPREKGLIRSSLAITMNRTNYFNADIRYSGTNPDNSLIDYFLGDADGTDVSQFDTDGFNYNTPTGLAYFNYLIGPVTIIDPLGDPTQYFTDVLGIPDQLETIEVRGSQAQWSFSYGANISDKFFIGAGVGFSILKYSADKVYSERFVGEPLDNFVLEEDLSIDGSGLNFTAGMIARPVDALQLGLSWTSPTSYDLTDEYSAGMDSQWNNFEYLPGTFLNNISALTDVVVSDYILKTPTRVTTGVAWFFGGNGLVSADAEFINYGKAKYKPGTDGVGFDDENQEIKDFYQAVVNLRVGGEYRLKDYRFRAGYSLMPDPYTTQSGDRSIASFSGGLGYRKQKFFADLAVVYKSTEGLYRPYTINSPSSPVVDLERSGMSVLLTVGIPF
jgi:long-subunit fatty acid transport protein